MLSTENHLARASYTYQTTLSKGLRRAFKSLPRPIRQKLKACIQLPQDALDALLGRRVEMVPPRYLNFAGDGKFLETGNEFLRYFIELGGLKQTDNILEVGCGVGRMARPLTKYLTAGTYEGIDIVPKGINWCQKEITRRYSNFRFQLADIRSTMYNPQGRFSAAEYLFPFEENRFDFIFLTSVFTHMMKQEVEHYVREIARVLRPEGTCFITFFLLNEESLGQIAAAVSSLTFQFTGPGCRIDDERNPDMAVSYEQSDVQSMLQNAGLTIQLIKYGAWSGRQEHLTYQDILIANKSSQ